jgi:hypothetical protein
MNIADKTLDHILLTHSASDCLLIGELNPFIFEVIADSKGLKHNCDQNILGEQFKRKDLFWLMVSEYSVHDFLVP